MHVSMLMERSLVWRWILEQLYQSLMMILIENTSCNPLTKTEIGLNSYTSEIQVLGSMESKVQYNGQQAKLLLIVVKGSDPPLPGRNRMLITKLDWANHLAIRSLNPLNNVTHEFTELLSDGVGHFSDPPVKIAIDDSVQLISCKSQIDSFFTETWY